MQTAPGIAAIRAALEPDSAFAEAVEGDACRWQGKIFGAHTLDVRLADGTRGYREIVRHHGGAGVVALDVDGRVCLVRQYRWSRFWGRRASPTSTPRSSLRANCAKGRRGRMRGSS